MKFSELMLDMATGDASIYDAYIQEAIGKINVSHAYFEAACKISELPEDEADFSIIQEAAEAGLPTDKAGSAGLADEAVVQELGAFFDLLVASAKKVQENINKSFGSLTGVGKGLNVELNMTNFRESFAKPLASAIVAKRGKSVAAGIRRGSLNAIELGSMKCLSIVNVKKLAKSYTQGITRFASAFGVSIGEVFNDPLVKHYTGNAAKITASVNLHDISNNIADGTGQIIDKKETSEHGNEYVTNVSKRDLVQLIECVYVVKRVTDELVQSIGKASVKSNVMNTITNAIRGTSDVTDKKGFKIKKSISSSIRDIDENIRFVTPKMADVVDNLVTGYGDSVYAIQKTIFGGEVPLPSKD